MSRFDFLILAAHGAGAHAFFRYLQIHPQIFPARTENLEYAARHPLPVLMNTLLPSKKYLTAWEYAAPDLVIQNPEVVEKLKLYTEPLALIQLVRDPIRLVLSIYNQQMQKSALRGEGQPPSIEDIVAERVPYCRFYEAGSLLAGHFKKWVLVDTTDISGDATVATMKRICETLGLPATSEYLADPGLSQPQNDDLHFLLRLHRFPITFADIELQCILQFPGSLDNFGTDDAHLYYPPRWPAGVAPYECKIGTIVDLPDSLARFRKYGPLNIMAAAENWMRFHPKIREVLVAENVFGRQMGTMITQSLQFSSDRMSLYKRLTVDELSRSVIDKLKNILRDDVQNLFKKEPRLREIWREWA